MWKDGFQSGWKGRQRLDYKIFCFLSLSKLLSIKIVLYPEYVGVEMEDSKYLRYGKEMISIAF